MADPLASWMDGLDAARPVPPAMRDRLQDAVVANTLEPEPENLPWLIEGPRRVPYQMRMRLVRSLIEDDRDVREAMRGIDRPRPLPAPAAARLEHALRRRSLRTQMRIYQMMGAAAVAILVLVGVLVVSNNGRHVPGSKPGQTTGALPTVKVPPAPDARSTPSPSTSVLGSKFTRPTPASSGTTTTGSRSAFVGEPAPAASSGGTLTPAGGEGFGSSDSMAPGSGNGRASSMNQPSPSQDTSLLGSVAALLDNVLKSLLGGKGAIHGLPADDSSMTIPGALTAPAAPAPAAPKTSASSVSTHRTRHSHSSSAATAPKVESPAPKATTAAPSTPMKLLSIGGGSSPVTISIPAAGLSVSL